MSTRTNAPLLVVLMTVACLLAGAPAHAQNIIDEWKSITAPPPPELKAVTIDPKTTALVLLDFNEQTCNMQRRPRCVAMIPKVKTLLAAARSAGAPVAFSLGGGGKPADLPADLVPAAGEPIVASGLDKFQGTELEKFLKDKGVKTIVIVGAASHGAVIYTVAGAVARGFKVIVPVNGIAADTLYAEQYSVWHLANAPIISGGTTLTSLEQVKF